MSLFTSKFDLRSFTPTSSPYKPKELDEKELEDLRQMSQDLSFESYLKGLEQKRTSNSPVSYADSWYQRMVQDSIALDVSDIPKTKDLSQNLNTTGPVRALNLKDNTSSFLSRFQSRGNEREEELTKIAENLGFRNVGQLAYDQYSNEFRYGTLGFHGASLTANMDGAQFELMTTNQNTAWAKTMHNLNMHMFEVSPAFQPTTELQWKLKESDGSKSAFYIHTDGTIVTKGSLNLPNLNDQEKLEPVTPDTIVGKNEDGSPILAKDSIPQKTIDEGLIALRRNDLEESFYNYNSGTVNNFGRFGRIGDFGQADQTVLGVIDTSNVPIVDFVRSMYDPGKTNADYIARELSTKIDGKQLVETIKTRDPLWYQDMLEQGIDMEKLAAMPTAGMFRAYVNGTYQRNAIARSLRTLEVADGWWWDKFYKGRETIYSTLVAGDAVAQVGLTVLSAGTNLAVAGSLTAARAVPTTVATSAARVAAIRAGVASNVTFSTKFAQGLQSVVRWLPANAPSTLVTMGLKRAPSLENGIKALHWSGQWAARGGLWTGAQAVEGLLEEGITDVVNQGYELSLGLRQSYDFSQTMTSAWQGALMEPILGGTLMAPMLAVGYTGQTLGRASLKSTTRWFGLDQSRVNEFNYYLSSLGGNFDNLSPIEQQVRQESVVRGLVMEEALGPISTGAFTKAETAFAKFAQMGLNLRSQFGNLSQGNFVNASLILSDVVTKWQSDWNSGNLESASRLEAARDLGLITIDTDESGNDIIKLTEDSTELFLNFIVTGAFGEKGSTARRTFIDKEFKTQLRQKILNENPDIQTELDAAKAQVEANPGKPEFKQKLLDVYNRLDQKLKEFVEDPAKTKEKEELMSTVVKKTTSALELFPSDSSKQQEETFSQATRDTLEMSDARLETALEPIGKIVADAKTKAVLVVPEVTPVAPEVTPTTTDLFRLSEKVKDQLKTVSNIDFEILTQFVNNIAQQWNGLHKTSESFPDTEEGNQAAREQAEFDGRIILNAKGKKPDFIILQIGGVSQDNLQFVPSETLLQVLNDFQRLQATENPNELLIKFTSVGRAGNSATITLNKTAASVENIKKELNNRGVTTPPILPTITTDVQAATDLIIDELRSTDLDLDGVKSFLTTMASKPGFSLDMLEGVLECLVQTKTNEEKVQQIQKLGCRKG
jgi:hypothetical protein